MTESYLFPNYQRINSEFVEGLDATVTDKNGKKYLDLTSGIGVTNLGHNHPLLTKVLHEQVDKIWHIPNLYSSQLQERVGELLANDKDYVAFFCNSGAEANEAAIKLARKHTGRTEIISFHQSFHGRTYAAMSATGQKKIHLGFDPLVPDFHYIAYNDPEEFQTAITKKTAAVMVEVIQGEGGVIPANKKWLLALAKHTQKMGALFIVDEIQTGIGRTGSLYAFEQYGIEPDIFTLAKGLGNGVPVGAMLGKKELASTFNPGSHGTTFGGNRLALSVAEKVVEIVRRKVFLEEIAKKESLVFNRLHQELGQHFGVVAIRGMGLMVGIELKNAVMLEKVVQNLHEKGVLVLKAGGNVLRLLPTLTIKKEELIEGIEKVIDTIKEMGKEHE